MKALSWPILNDTLFLEVRFSNPFLDVEYPGEGRVSAVLDTGFTGFALVPEEIFDALRLSELKPIRAKALLANGGTIPLRGAYGVLEIPEIGHNANGLIETSGSVNEVLIGISGIRRLKATLDGCRGEFSLQRCSPPP